MKYGETFPYDKLACVDNKWKGVNKLILFFAFSSGKGWLKEDHWKNKKHDSNRKQRFENGNKLSEVKEKDGYLGYSGFRVRGGRRRATNRRGGDLTAGPLLPRLLRDRRQEGVTAASRHLTHQARNLGKDGLQSMCF